MENKVKNTSKYYAQAVFNTWAKVGYLFEFESGESWFICEYLYFMKPALFSKIFNQNDPFSIEKIVFGGYQSFKLSDDSNTSFPTFEETCQDLQKKGIISPELQEFWSRLDVTNSSDLNQGTSNTDSGIKFSYFGIENFRNFENFEEFSIKPITFITGRNNSGKSSILKAILLLREMDYNPIEDSFFIQKSEVLNLNINEISNKENSSENVIIAVNLDYKLKQFRREEISIKFFFKIIEGKLVLRKLIIDFVKPYPEYDFILKLEILENTKKRIQINKEIFDSAEQENNFLEYLFTEKGMGFNTLFNYKNEHISLINLLKLTSESSIISREADNELNLFLASIANLFYDFKNSISYVPSLRSENKRSFDPEKSMLGKTIKMLDSHRSISGSTKKQVYDWFDKFGLGTNYSINQKSDGTYELKFDNINIADLGFGYMQIFTVIVESIFASTLNKHVIFIEEPESNLHPNLQSLLADFFSEINKKNGTQFILETHSEYMVRKSQVLIREDKFSPEIIKIIYVNKESGKNIDISIDSEGYLTQAFGEGFYDESLKQIEKFQ